MTDETKTHIDYTDTFFKTEQLTCDPDQVIGITLQGTKLEIHTYHHEKPITVINFKGDLADVTNAWAQARWNKDQYETLKWAARQNDEGTPALPTEAKETPIEELLDIDSD